MQTSIGDVGGNAMTQSSDPDQSIEAATRALRHDILSSGRNASWEDLRGRIKPLLIHRRPLPAERLELLVLYDLAVTSAEQRCCRDPGGLRLLGHQRAADTLAFLLAEIRDLGDIHSPEIAAALLARE